jgi:threonine/homoserine/homoserine lactone efflux protein
MSFWEGLSWGLATALLLGPVFFTLLRAALDHGFRGGALVAAGIIVSDVLVLVLCLSGARLVGVGFIDEQRIAFAGGILLLCMGLVYLFKKSQVAVRPHGFRKRDALGLFTSGFLVNFVNPFVFAVWAGLVLHATNRHGAGGERAAFFLAVLVGILASDLLKAWLAPRLARLLSGDLLMWIRRAIGLLLLLSSARLLWLGFA